MKKNDRISGNILGGSRAEIDKAMLSKAFVKTHDFQALVNMLSGEEAQENLLFF